MLECESRACSGHAFAGLDQMFFSAKDRASAQEILDFLETLAPGIVQEARDEELEEHEEL